MSDPNFQFPILTGDIGGTNARFQVISSHDGDVVGFPWISVKDFVSLEDALDKMVFSKCADLPKTAILSAAGPLIDDGIDLTNSPWTINHRSFLSQTPCNHLIVLNDFEAQALALPFLEEDHLQPIGGTSDSVSHKGANHKVVIGAGTGLGVAILADIAGKWAPICGEGGHVELGPVTEQERAIWPHLKRIEERISAEEVLSGRGLANLYQAVCRTRAVAPTLKHPEDISKSGLVGDDPNAKEALDLFCNLLGRVAGDLALTILPAGGVYIAGGIAQEIASFMVSSTFRKTFDSKAPHQALMQTFPTHLITHPHSALLGLEILARDPSRFLLDISHRTWSQTSE